MADDAEGSSLFAVFALSILSLVLIPWTIYKFCAAFNAPTSIESAGRKKNVVLRKVQEHLTLSNACLVLLWAVAAGMVVYIQATQESKPFDPFEILGVSTSASDKEIKSAYRQLALQYHPDKNKDPKAHQYFADYITKAHAALTDPKARENWEKYGHPDGNQGVDLGIALPSFLIAMLKDEKVAPMVLLLLVACFILLPLAVMGCCLLRSNKFTGPNNIMHETLEYYAYSKYNVKESQSIVRIPETLVIAKEFITLHTPSEHQPACEELRKLVLRYHPDLKEKALFWKRRGSVLKAHLLLLTHLEREHENVPSLLKADMKYVQERTVPLLEEIIKIACLPRRPFGFGWLTPTVGAIQLSQCIIQAVPISARKAQASSKRDQTDGFAALLQLPGMNGEIVRQMQRQKIKSLSDLVALEKERVQFLDRLRLPNTVIEDIDTAIAALPQLTVTAECVVDGEEGIIEGDMVTCRVRLVVTRGSHTTGDFSESDLRGNGVQVFAPCYPFKRTEKWYVLLAHQSWNAVINWTHVSLKEAELFGLQYGDPIEKRNNGEENEDVDLTGAQCVELKFAAPQEGNYEFQVICMSDCWIGCDQTIPVKLSVKKATRMSQPESAPAPVGSDSEDDIEQVEDVPAKSTPRSDEEEDEEENDEEDDYDYDSDETGEMETESDDDTNPPEAVELIKGEISK